MLFSSANFSRVPINPPADHDYTANIYNCSIRTVIICRERLITRVTIQNEYNIHSECVNFHGKKETLTPDSDLSYRLENNYCYIYNYWLLYMFSETLKTKMFLRKKYNNLFIRYLLYVEIKSHKNWYTWKLYIFTRFYVGRINMIRKLTYENNVTFN